MFKHDLYRKCTVYVKSPRQWQAEKARRRQVLALWNTGVHQAEISVKLGISIKTVQRDIKKLKPYITRQNNQVQQKISAKFDECFNRLPPSLQYQIVGATLFADKETQARFISAVWANNIPVLWEMCRKKRRPSRMPLVRRMSPEQIQREIAASLAEPEW